MLMSKVTLHAKTLNPIRFPTKATQKQRWASTVERIWHTQDSQGHIRALAFRLKTLSCSLIARSGFRVQGSGFRGQGSAHFDTKPDAGMNSRKLPPPPER